MPVKYIFLHNYYVVGNAVYYYFFTDQYIMKLFDRSVDLAQFDEDSPLYPICRSWLKNRPYDRDTMDKDKSSSPEHEAHSDEEVH